MTTEELLQPRYKVLQDFWDSPFKVGDVINFNLYSDSVYRTCIDGLNLKVVEAFECYPQFKKLEWWEERKVEDMPKYIKSNCDEWVVCPIYHDDENTGLFYLDEDGADQYSTSRFLPATEQEYLSYQTTLK